MAIFGTFKDLAFPDVVALVAKDSGILKIYNPRCTLVYELRIRNGVLVGMTVGDRTVEDTPSLRHYLTEIALEENAEFSYERVALAPTAEDFGIPVERLVASCMAVISQPEAFSDHLPHPETRFVVNEEGEGWLEDDLFDFWCKAYPLLKEGASGAQIAAALGFDPGRVVFELFKLRALGLIVPFRQFERKTLPVSAQPSAATQTSASLEPRRNGAQAKAPVGSRKGWIRRLLDAMSRIWMKT
jgi:hypothetical protein